MKKTIEQHFCDSCGKNITESKKFKGIRYPIIFETEQTEGSPCTPYRQAQIIDLCEDCVNKVLKGKAVGAQGYNTYRNE